MNKGTKYRVLALLVGLAFLACSTTALSHGHSGSIDESHCSFCLTAHAVAHVVFCPPVALHVALIQTALYVGTALVLPSSQRLTPAQGRAPPATA
jgi:hypothetical protein